MDPVRQELRAQGEAVLQHLRHGTNPPRDRPLHLGSIDGLHHYTAEALWGSVWARPALDIETRTLLTLAVLTSLQRLGQLRTYLHSALNIGIRVERIEEVLIQCSVLAGFPTTVNALELLREALERRGVVVAEVADAAADESAPELGVDELERRGRQLRIQLFGAESGLQPGSAPAAQVLGQVEDRFVFGELYLRPALELPVRVACTIASLVALRELDELARWLAAGIRVGLSEESICETILQVAHYAGFPAARQALEVAERVLAPPISPTGEAQG